MSEARAFVFRERASHALKKAIRAGIADETRRAWQIVARDWGHDGRAGSGQVGQRGVMASFDGHRAAHQRIVARAGGCGSAPATHPGAGSGQLKSLSEPRDASGQSN